MFQNIQEIWFKMERVLFNMYHAPRNDMDNNAVHVIDLKCE